MKQKILSKTKLKYCLICLEPKCSGDGSLQEKPESTTAISTDITTYNIAYSLMLCYYSAMAEELRGYCHDKDIARVARHLGVTDGTIINNACGLGEGPYNGFDRAVYYLNACDKKRRVLKDRGRMPKTGLSKNQKRDILQRYSLLTEK